MSQLQLSILSLEVTVPVCHILVEIIFWDRHKKSGLKERVWCQFAQCGENRLALPNLAEQAFYKICNNVFLTSPSNCIYLS